MTDTDDKTLLMMHELPLSERPREKMLKQGAQAMSEAELIAILLRTGLRDVPVNRLAERLLAKYKLSGLGNIPPQELSQNPGIGPVKAITIAAGLELGKRLVLQESEAKVKLQSPADAVALLMPRLRYLGKESFVALLLSTKNHVLTIVTISTGTLSASLVHPRELFREAIYHGAAAIIVGHNHPSGDPSPSQEDIQLTKRLIEAGKLLDIPVLDHLIIGDGEYVSLKEKGLI